MIDHRARLMELSDGDNARFVAKLVPGKDNILGARIPQIRALAKEISNDDWRAVLAQEPLCFEEELLDAILIATVRIPVEERISLIEGFLPHFDNWSTCDTFCTTYKVKEGDRTAVWDYFASLMESGEEFPMRLSLIMRMSAFKDEASIRALLEDIASHDNEGYYYRMGAAWAVSVCYVRCPEETERLLRSGRLCDWTQNKSIQKIRESYRVSAEDKERLSALKRRAL